MFNSVPFTLLTYNKLQSFSKFIERTKLQIQLQQYNNNKRSRQWVEVLKSTPPATSKMPVTYFLDAISTVQSQILMTHKR